MIDAGEFWAPAISRVRKSAAGASMAGAAGMEDTMNDLHDRKLVCMGCSREFIFSSSEQEFYRSKGFENVPTRCPECRAQRKKTSFGGDGAKKADFHDIVCSACGKTTKVPFKPAEGKPVFCRECHQSRKSQVR